MGNLKKIVYRADASSVIGYGHFIRTLALAEILKDDFKSVFVTINPSKYQIVELRKVCEFISLPDDQTHFELFLSFLKGDEIVVLDNYYFTTEYQILIKSKGCKLVCIDDMHDKHYVADLIIHQGISDSSAFSVELYTKFCLGMDWLLLRSPFIEAYKNCRTKNLPKSIEKIVVCFGGADIYNLTDKTLSFLDNNQQISQIDIIVGSRKHSNILKTKNIKVRYFQNISANKIVDIFTHCDLAIVTTSTISLEALACRTLLATGYYVDNQKEFYKYLIQNKIAMGLDNLLDDKYLVKLDNFLQYYNPSYFSTIDLNLENIDSRYKQVFSEL